MIISIFIEYSAEMEEKEERVKEPDYDFKKFNRIWSDLSVNCVKTRIDIIFGHKVKHNLHFYQKNILFILKLI